MYLEIYMYLYMQESVRKWDFTCTTYDADRPRMPVASEGCSKFVFGKPKHVCVIFLFTLHARGKLHSSGLCLPGR